MNVITLRRTWGLTTSPSWQHPSDFIPVGTNEEALAEMERKNTELGRRAWHVTSCLVEIA